MTRYHLSPEAQGDLTAIQRYLIGQGGVRLARYVLGEIRGALQFLAANPGAGHSREDLTGQTLPPGPRWPHVRLNLPVSGIGVIVGA